MRSNCILFTLALYWRRGESRLLTVGGERYFVLWRSGDGRYILIRRSRLGGWIPHMLYGEKRNGKVRIVHFVPVDDRPKPIPPPVFRGHRRWGD